MTTTPVGGSSGGSDPVTDQMNASMAQFQQESAQQMQEESAFSELQAKSSLGNKIAGSNPSQ